jgi:hypothetical protein
MTSNAYIPASLPLSQGTHDSPLHTNTVPSSCFSQIWLGGGGVVDQYSLNDEDNDWSITEDEGRGVDHSW